MDYTKTPNTTSEKIEKSEKLENLDYNMEYIDPPEAKVPFANYYNEQILPFIREEEAKIEAEEAKIKAGKNKILSYIKRKILILKSGIFILFFVSIIYTLCLGFLYTLFYFIASILIANFEILKVDKVFIVYVYIFFIVLVYNAFRGLKDDKNIPIFDLVRFKLQSEVLSKALRFIVPSIQEIDKSPIAGKELMSFCALEGDYYFEKQENTYNYKKGNYKNASFELYQHLEYNKNYEPYELLSEHLFIILNLDTNFTGTTIIVDREINSVGWVGEDFEHLSKITLVGSNFDNNKSDHHKFDVYSSDQKEVRNLLNSRFMDAILKLDNLFNQRLSQVSYHKNQVVFIIEKWGLKTDNYLYNKNYAQELQRLFKQIDIIFEIIDTLKPTEQTRV